MYSFIALFHRSFWLHASHPSLLPCLIREPRLMVEAMVVPRRRRKQPWRSSSPPSEARQSTCAQAGRARPCGVARRRQPARAAEVARFGASSEAEPARARRDRGGEAEPARMWRGGGGPLARGRGGSLSRPAARRSLLAHGAVEAAQRRRAHLEGRSRHDEGELGEARFSRRGRGGLLAARQRRARRGALLAARRRRPAHGSRAARWKRRCLTSTVEELGHDGLACPTLLMKRVRFLSVSFNLVSRCWKRRLGRVVGIKRILSLSFPFYKKRSERGI